jgi:hypothetical protein
VIALALGEPAEAVSSIESFFLTPVSSRRPAFSR